jgi:hypothetical protein
MPEKSRAESIQQQLVFATKQEQLQPPKAKKSTIGLPSRKLLKCVPTSCKEVACQEEQIKVQVLEPLVEQLRTALQVQPPPSHESGKDSTPSASSKLQMEKMMRMRQLKSEEPVKTSAQPLGTKLQNLSAAKKQVPLKEEQCPVKSAPPMSRVKEILATKRSCHSACTDQSEATSSAGGEEGHSSAEVQGPCAGGTGDSGTKACTSRTCSTTHTVTTDLKLGTYASEAPSIFVPSESEESEASTAAAEARSHIGCASSTESNGEGVRSDARCRHREGKHQARGIHTRIIGPKSFDNDKLDDGGLEAICEEESSQVEEVVVGSQANMGELSSMDLVLAYLKEPSALNAN